jgi:hypothetical protein
MTSVNRKYGACPPPPRSLRTDARRLNCERLGAGACSGPAACRVVEHSFILCENPPIDVACVTRRVGAAVARRAGGCRGTACRHLVAPCGGTTAGEVLEMGLESSCQTAAVSRRDPC